MVWFWALGLISVLFILAGISLSIKRVRIYRQETEARRARAFTEMMEIGKKKNAEKNVIRDS